MGNTGKDPKNIKKTKVKHFNSLKDVYMLETKDLFSIFPRLDISDGIYMLGDYFNTDYSQPKAWTEFNIKVDWLEV